MPRKIVRRCVTYYPPPPEVINRFAHEVCAQMGKKVDASYDTLEIAVELSAFVRTIASVYAKHLTNQSMSKNTGKKA
jgi:hypothetical protein